MDYDRIIAVSNDIAIYRHGNKRIKVFIQNNQFINALEETFKTQRVKELTNLNVPKTYSVGLKDNRVEILFDYIEGETLTQKLKSDTSKTREIILQLIDLQNKINGYFNILNCFKSADNSVISPFVGNKPVLCHGDLSLDNVVITPNGEMFVLNWEYAFEGDKRLDFASTYYGLYYDFSKDEAELYLEEYCKANNESKENLLNVCNLVLKDIASQSKGDKKTFLNELLKK